MIHLDDLSPAVIKQAIAEGLLPKPDAYYMDGWPVWTRETIDAHLDKSSVNIHQRLRRFMQTGSINEEQEC